MTASTAAATYSNRVNFRKIWAILKATFSEFGEHKTLRLSAALAYYSMFSIGPLLVIAVGVAGLVFGHESVHRQIQQQLQGMLGQKAASTLGSMMAAQKHSTSLLTTIVGLIALFFGAAGVFGQLQDALNTIWEVKPKPNAGLLGLIRARFLSLTMVLGTGFLLLVSMALTTFISALTGSLGSRLPVPETVMHILNFVVSFGVISFLFAMIFKYLPDVKVPFRKVWVGAITTAFLFAVGKYLLALYLGRASTTSSFGAAGSVILIMMWVYYASVILLFGAEFTHVYVKQTSTRIVTTKYAEPMTQEEQAKQGIPQQPRPVPQRRPAGVLAEPFVQSRNRSQPPGAVLRRRPLQLASLMLVAGFTGGLLVRFKGLRKFVRLYLDTHRM
jgi:membrane protein